MKRDPPTPEVDETSTRGLADQALTTPGFGGLGRMVVTPGRAE